MTLPVLPALLALLPGLGDPCSSELPGNMPDLDQVRRAAMFVDGSPVLGLDNDGYGYCAPTTTLDVFVYLANNGYSSLPPGPGGYLGGGNAQYNTFRNYLWSVGFGMSTDPVNGTNNADWNFYLSGVIGTAGLTGSILTANIFTDSNSAPTLGDIKACCALGWPAIVACGWYQPERGHYVRHSGHVFVARRVTDFCTPGQHKIGFRDPATDNDLDADGDGHPDGDHFRQSQPSTETYLANPDTQVFDIGNTSYNGPLEYMQGYTFDGLAAGTRAYIDSVRIFIPAFGLSPCCSNLGVGVTQSSPSGGAPIVTTFLLPPGREIVDVVPSARRHRMFAIVDRTNAAAPRTLWQIDRDSGSVTQVVIPLSPERICTGNDPSLLYVLHEDCLIYTTIGTQVGAPTTAPGLVTALAFDHAQNQLVALSSAARRIFRFNADTMALVSNQLIPSIIPLGSSPRITVSPTTGHLWLTSGVGGGNRADALTGTGATLAIASTINTASPALGIDSDDRGHIFTSILGSVREFAPPISPATAWTPVTGKWASLTSSSGAFSIVRSVSNFRAGLHDGEAWTRVNLPKVGNPPSVPDCPPDVNNSGTVTVQDIFDFLMFYFSGDPRGDFNDSNTISVQDIFDFLAAYFTGCS